MPWRTNKGGPEPPLRRRIFVPPTSTNASCTPAGMVCVTSVPWSCTLRGFLERIGELQLGADLPQGRQHFLAHQCETAHGILVADGPIIGPDRQNPRAHARQHLTELPDYGVGATNNH